MLCYVFLQGFTTHAVWINFPFVAIVAVLKVYDCSGLVLHAVISCIIEAFNLFCKH